MKDQHALCAPRGGLPEVNLVSVLKCHDFYRLLSLARGHTFPCMVPENEKVEVEMETAEL